MKGQRTGRASPQGRAGPGTRKPTAKAGGRESASGRPHGPAPRRPAAELPQAARPSLPKPRAAKAAPPPQLPPSDTAARGTETVGVQMLAIMPDEAGMRVDRLLTARFPDLSFAHIQRILRKGELRVDGRRAKPSDRLEAGQQVRVPPLRSGPKSDIPRTGMSKDAEFLRSIILFEDADVLVLNKPMGLAVQGGSGTHRHVDGMLDSLRDRDGQKPRLVHRLDKDTAGCLVVAKTRFAATALAKSFRSRETRKIYWALVAGVPRTKQGRISTYLAKEEVEHESVMRIAEHGKGATHALTYYAVVDQAAQKLAWLSLKPVTGRTHQLRAHTAHIGNPIVGDPKYFNVENWELPGGIQNVLHLMARRIVIPHPRTGKPVDVTAPLPAHIRQSFSLLGFDTSRYDPIEEAPES